MLGRIERPRNPLAFVGRCQTLRGSVELLQTISVAIYRGQAPAVFGREAELVADAAHVRVKRARCHHRVRPPYTFADVTAREQPADIAQEQNREIEVLRSQFDLALLAHYGARLGVDLVHI